MSTTQGNQGTPDVHDGGARRLPARLHARADKHIDLSAAAGPLLVTADDRTGADPHLVQDLTAVLDWLGQSGSPQPVR